MMSDHAIASAMPIMQPRLGHWCVPIGVMFEAGNLGLLKHSDSCRLALPAIFPIAKKTGDHRVHVRCLLGSGVNFGALMTPSHIFCCDFLPCSCLIMGQRWDFMEGLHGSQRICWVNWKCFNETKQTSVCSTSLIILVLVASGHPKDVASNVTWWQMPTRLQRSQSDPSAVRVFEEVGADQDGTGLG